jgi:hypothetical protein
MKYLSAQMRNLRHGPTTAVFLGNLTEELVMQAMLLQQKIILLTARGVIATTIQGGAPAHI